MQMSTLSLDTPSAGTPAGDLAGTPAGTGEGGERFADQLVQAQAGLPPGQNLAAAGLTLKTLTLGPALEVLTSSSGNPEGDSLAEFAKAQGLDDDVVAWLFSDATQAQIQAQTLMPIALQTPPGVMALPVTTAGAGSTSDPADLAIPTLQTATTGATPATGQATLTLAPTAQAGAEAEVDALALAATSTATWLQSQQAAWSGKDAKASATAAALDPAQVPVASTLMAVTAATMRPARVDVTADLTRAVTANTDMPVEILSLDVQPGLESLWDQPDAGADHAGSHPQGGHPSHAGDTPPGANPAAAGDDGLPPATTLTQRAAGYQELSQRLGEALAQRLMSQIERGNWEVRLLLKPAKLGEVEIDLTLRSGALDASFRATNPVTRDLLNDGLPRLREVLANAGMDIAGLNVGSGRSQQTGGNPTPRHARATQGPETADTGVVATSAPVMQTRLRGPGDSGWDVLV